MHIKSVVYKTNIYDEKMPLSQYEMSIKKWKFHGHVIWEWLALNDDNKVHRNG